MPAHHNKGNFFLLLLHSVFFQLKPEQVLILNLFICIVNINGKRTLILFSNQAGEGFNILEY